MENYDGVSPHENAASKRNALRLLLGALIAPLLLIGALDTALAQENSPLPPGATFRDGPDFPEMVVIPPGDFMMGSYDHEYDYDIAQLGLFGRWLVRSSERSTLPRHHVIIKSTFALGTYDVTRGEFAVFVKDSGYVGKSSCMTVVGEKYSYSFGNSWQNPGFVQTDKDPVVCVSWQDAQAYILWLNKILFKNTNGLSKKIYRFPTEAEWEYAARGGRSTARWWGDAIGENNTNCKLCSSNLHALKTTPVGKFKPNPFGLYDVLGNVWQWTSDCWHSNYINAPNDGSSWEGYSCSGSHVMRGASWDSDPWLVRSATRTDPGPSKYTSFIGFRIAKQIN